MTNLTEQFNDYLIDWLVENANFTEGGIIGIESTIIVRVEDANHNPDGTEKKPIGQQKYSPDGYYRYFSIAIPLPNQKVEPDPNIKTNTK